MSASSRSSNVSTSEKDKVKPLHVYLDQYIQQLGDRQRKSIEKFYHEALERPCGGSLKCENSHGDMTYFGCSFLSPKHHHYVPGVTSAQSDDCDYNNMDMHTPQDPFNPNMVGPKHCEYCGAKTTLQCDPRTCDRPQLFFSKKKPPFESSRGDLVLADSYSNSVGDNDVYDSDRVDGDILNGGKGDEDAGFLRRSNRSWSGGNTNNAADDRGTRSSNKGGFIGFFK